jgi:CRP/FNR family transcriptional regulator
MIPEQALTDGTQHFAVLGRLSPHHRQLISSRGSMLTIESGRPLFETGDRCEGLGLVVSGCVRVSCISEGGRELVLYRVRAGETCTITASCLLTERTFPAIGTIEQDLIALFIPTEGFRTLLAESPPFRDFVFTIFTSRVDHLMELVNEVAFNRLDTRIASRLLELGPVVRMTHQQLAAEVGSTREMASRILESLADRGLLHLGRKRIEIVDAEALRRAIESR